MKFPNLKFPNLLHKAGCYKRLFLLSSGQPNEDAKRVLADLAKFCNANRLSIRVSPVSGLIDPIAVGVAEGRREVWLRIQNRLNLDEETILKLVEQSEREDRE